MKDSDEYRFVIDALSPDTLPMARLAEYMADLARLLGRTNMVHFVRIEAGSAALVQKVDREAASEVRQRLRAVGRGAAPKDATGAFEALDRRLAVDDATGSLREDGGGEMLRFPGRERPQPPTFGAFDQPGVLDGVLIRVGGKDETVPVHLRDGDAIHLCNADRDMARRLAVHLFGPTLRVRGDGRWERAADGAWSMKHFDIEEFDELDDAPLREVVDELRAVPGNGWKDIDDPAAELRRLRGLDGPR